MRDLTRAWREAKRLLRSEHGQKAPVDVYGIARRHALVIERVMEDDICGMLVPIGTQTDDRHWAIVVNARHPEVRRRFTVAHELAHLLLHKFSTPHADRRFKVRFRSLRSSGGTVAEEVEANRFAAELLMPTDLVVAELQDVEMDFAPANEENVNRRLDEVAKKFNVSRQALHIRISNLFF